MSAPSKSTNLPEDSAIKQALRHIAGLHPEVTQVVYDEQFNWDFSDGNGQGPEFGIQEDMSLLEHACDEAYELDLCNVAIRL